MVDFWKQVIYDLAKEMNVSVEKAGDLVVDELAKKEGSYDPAKDPSHPMRGWRPEED